MFFLIIGNNWLFFLFWSYLIFNKIALIFWKIKNFNWTDWNFLNGFLNFFFENYLELEKKFHIKTMLLNHLNIKYSLIKFSMQLRNTCSLTGLTCVQPWCVISATGNKKPWYAKNYASWFSMHKKNIPRLGYILFFFIPRLGYIFFLLLKIYPKRGLFFFYTKYKYT